MRKRSITLLTYGLALMFLMYNCKKKDTDPLTPDQGLVDEINKIDVEKVTLIPAAPVVATESKIEASAEAAAVNNAISEMATSGVVPESLKSAGATISASLSESEVAAMSSLTPEMLAAVEAGGALPANIQAIMTKAAANPALAKFFPQVTLPTVNGVELKGMRTSGIEGTEAVEAILVNDACLAAAEAAFQEVKTKLDASRATQLAGVATQYAADIAPLAAAETACTAALPTKYDALRAEEKAAFGTLNSLLDTQQGVLGPLLYIQMKVQIYIAYLGTVTSLNQLQVADSQACLAKTVAATNNAQAARDANTAAVEAAYATALAAATTAKGELAESCHNQGGGQ